MEKYVYQPKGVCSQKFEFEIENDVIHSLKVTGGCNGNLQGIAKLIQNRTCDDVIQTLEGIHCGPRPTSCPDQIAMALKSYLANH